MNGRNTRAESLQTGDYVPGFGTVLSVWFDAAGVLVTFAGGKTTRWGRRDIVAGVK